MTIYHKLAAGEELEGTDARELFKEQEIQPILFWVKLAIALLKQEEPKLALSALKGIRDRLECPDSPMARASHL